MAECAWCRGPIPTTMRRDALCCSVRCRQARHRFVTGVGVGQASSEYSLRLAYADPPYPGLSKRYYEHHPDYAGEVDHAELIRRLSTYDGWALSTSAAALPQILALCPDPVRVAAWVRGERPTRSGRPLNAWEPVIYSGGRIGSRSDASQPGAHDASTTVQNDTSAGHDASPLQPRHMASRYASRSDRRDPDTTRSEDPRDANAGVTRRVDALVHFSRPRLTDPSRVVGAKPAAFCRWMFDLLGAEPQDDFTDLFAGSGGVQRAWDAFSIDARRLEVLHDA